MFKRVFIAILIIFMILVVSTVYAIEENDTQSVEQVEQIEEMEVELDEFEEVSKILTFVEWLRIRDIEEELKAVKNSLIVRIINTSLIVIGTMILIIGILMIFAYWFDVLNTFTSFSILNFISFGRIYPVMNKDILQYTEKSRRLVTFKDVMLRVMILWITGFMLYESNIIIEIIIKIYLYLSGI